MDVIYYISAVLMCITFIGLIVAIVVFLLKPHYLNKSQHIKKPVSRLVIVIVGLASIFISFLGYGTVLAATEPASVKQERAVREAAELRMKQAKEAEETRRVRLAEEDRKRQEEAKKPQIKTETATEVIPFESIEQQDNTLAKGQTRIATEGVNGTRTFTYDVTYVSGKKTARKEVKNEVTTAPATRVTQIGAYVAPAPTPRAVPTPAAPQVSPPSAYYKNCSAARAAGAAPVYTGQPGYGRHLDRDGDGIGCE